MSAAESDRPEARFREVAPAEPPVPPSPGQRTGFVTVPPTVTGIAFSNSIAPLRMAANNNLMNGSGLAAGDFDQDGWCDLYFCALDGKNALYRNLGGWRFEEDGRIRGGRLPGSAVHRCLFRRCGWRWAPGSAGVNVGPGRSSLPEPGRRSVPRGHGRSGAPVPTPGPLRSPWEMWMAMETSIFTWPITERTRFSAPVVGPKCGSRTDAGWCWALTRTGCVSWTVVSRNWANRMGFISTMGAASSRRCLGLRSIFAIPRANHSMHRGILV